MPIINNILDVGADGNNDRASVYFNSNDCTGSPYLTAWDHIIHNANKAYSVTGAPFETFAGSSLGSDGLECHPEAENRKYPAKEVTLPFTLPVSVPLKFVYE